MRSSKMPWAGLGLVVAACGGGGDLAWEGTIVDSAGIQVVKNTGVGLWAPEDAWTFAEEVRIGTAEGEPEYQFGQINAGGSIDVASDGRIVVLDAQGQHIKVFTADGTYERTIGGPGGGPGEIGQGGQSAVLVAPGDTVFLGDFGNQRVNLYQMDGTFIRSFPLNLADGIPFRWETTANGRIVAQLRRLAFPGSTAPPDTMDAIVVKNLDGTTGDTLLRITSGKTVSFSGGAPEWFLFSPEPLWSTWGDRLLVAVNDQYRISVRSPVGSVERIVEMPFTLDPVTEADQATMKDGFQKLLLAQGVPPQIATQLVQSRLHFAPNYPAFAQMLEGPTGAILVQLIQPISRLSPEERESFDIQSGSLGSRKWDVFDRQGRYLGAVEMPLRFQPVEFKGDKIYGVQRDDLDVQYVVVLRVERGDETT